MTGKMTCLWGIMILGTVLTASSAEEAGRVTPKTEGGIQWFNAADWQTGGQGWSEGIGHYMRVPDRALDSLPPGYRKYADNTAGLYFLFRTDATSIQIRFRLTSAQLAMEHMPATGVSGFDLYARDEKGEWRWAGINYPTAREETAEIVGALAGKMTEYRLLLPLYNGVESLEIGVPEGAVFIAENPDGRKPVFQYGSSIDHGGCASRPGNAYCAVMSRRLDYPFVNFGFSGSACLEPEVAELIAETDPALFLLATFNATSDIVAERGIRFIEIIRRKHPDTPIVLVGNYSVMNRWARPAVDLEYRRKAENVRALYDHFMDAGDENIYLIDTSNFCGENIDWDGTVDGLHPNDLGMRRYADAVEEGIRPLLKNGDQRGLNR